jgi:hypothetical protein
MSWLEPKTEWKPTDKYNVSDYNRQKHNIGYIANETLPTLAYRAEFEPGMPLDRPDKPKAEVINVLEQGLSAIEASGVPLPPEWQPGKTWEGGDKPDYTDANRWEGNVKAVYEMAQKIYVRWRPAGTFAAGQTNILPRKVM